MKLLTLPSVVQRNVFELLGFKQLLIISFCSKRTRYLIQSLQKYRWKDIKFVKYSFEEEDNIYVNVRSENINEGFILSPNTLEQLVITPMDVFGMGSEIPICLHPIYYGGRYIYDKEQTQIVVQGIHDYLYQFFGSSIDYEVESIEDQLPPILKNINRTCIKVPENMTAEELEAYFTASPNQKYIQLEGDFNGNLCPNSAILGAEHLKVNCDGYGDQLLLGFRGKRLACTGSFRDSTIFQFLNAWRLNRGFHNLESVEINSSECNNYGAADPLKDMDVKQLDRPEDILHITWQVRRLYSSRNVISMFPAKTWKLGFSSRDYLIRDGDGEKASVSIKNHDVYFALWKGNSCEIENIND